MRKLLVAATLLLASFGTANAIPVGSGEFLASYSISNTVNQNLIITIDYTGLGEAFEAFPIGVENPGGFVFQNIFDIDFQPVNNFYNAPGQGNPPPMPEVPIPATAWLFGSGLLGLVGFARRKMGQEASGSTEVFA